MKNQFRQVRRFRRRALTDEKATELRIQDEAQRRWRSWIPSREEHHRPRLATFERRVRDEFKAKVARREVTPAAATEECVVGKTKAKTTKARGAVKGKTSAKKIIDARTGKPVTPETVGLTPEQVMADPPQTADRAPPGMPGGVRPGSKLEAIVGLLTRPEGCTTKDVLAATGWPSVSMPQQAKAAGLTLRKEKVGGVTRYSAAA